MLNPRVASRCNNQLCKIKISKLERKLQSYESGEMVKGSSHFIFEINVGKSSKMTHL